MEAHNKTHGGEVGADVKRWTFARSLFAVSSLSVQLKFDEHVTIKELAVLASKFTSFLATCRFRCCFRMVSRIGRSSADINKGPLLGPVSVRLLANVGHLQRRVRRKQRVPRLRLHDGDNGQRLQVIPGGKRSSR